MTVRDSTVLPDGEEPRRVARQGIVGTALDLMLAAIGIVGVLNDDAQALYERSIERGHGTVRSVQQRLGLAQRPKEGSSRELIKRLMRGESAADVWPTQLARRTIPTSAEVDAIGRQVADLEAKIDELVAMRAAQSE